MLLETKRFLCRRTGTVERVKIPFGSGFCAHKHRCRGQNVLFCRSAWRCRKETTAIIPGLFSFVRVARPLSPSIQGDLSEPNCGRATSLSSFETRQREPRPAKDSHSSAHGIPHPGSMEEESEPRLVPLLGMCVVPTTRARKGNPLRGVIGDPERTSELANERAIERTNERASERANPSTAGAARPGTNDRCSRSANIHTLRAWPIAVRDLVDRAIRTDRRKSPLGPAGSRTRVRYRGLPFRRVPSFLCRFANRNCSEDVSGQFRGHPRFSSGERMDRLGGAVSWHTVALCAGICRWAREDGLVTMRVMSNRSVLLGLRFRCLWRHRALGHSYLRDDVGTDDQRGCQCPRNFPFFFVAFIITRHLDLSWFLRGCCGHRTVDGDAWFRYVKRGTSVIVSNHVGVRAEERANAYSY